MVREWQSQQYDHVYATGSVDKVYDLPYRHSGYYPLFRTVCNVLRARGSRSVLEVGCGTGGFAHLWHDQNPAARYRGFDFSPVAVEKARERTGRTDAFFVGDARAPGSYSGDFDSIVCTEVLEHIEDDLEVINNWGAGTLCVCSVPNFAADNHVRVFKSADDVIKRYSSNIEIESVRHVKKPYLFDLSLQSYLRELRWNRYRPERIARILGMVSFDTGGGWFVFVGRCRAKCI